MKKITILFLLLITSYSYSQTWTTGPVTVTTGYSVQFDVDTTTDLVTLTMIGPDSQWLGVAIGVSSGNSMGNTGDDVVVYNSIGFQDRNMTGSTGQPNTDSSQDWTVLSNNTAGGIRTLVATRARVTGDSNDFAFSTSGGALPLLWAMGSSLTMGYHANRGGTVANLTLNTNKFIFTDFKVTPNPITSRFNVVLPTNLSNALVEVYDVLGKQIYTNDITEFNSSIDASSWNSGIYMVRVSTGDTSQTKRIIKQ